MASDTKKEKALDLAINQIDRQFGKGAIMRMGDDHVSISDNIIPTGCLSLDVALGVGGAYAAKKAYDKVKSNQAEREAEKRRQAQRQNDA